MILHLAAEIFEATARDERKLLRLLLAQLDNPVEAHSLRIDPESAETDPTGPVMTWMKTLGDDDRDALRSAIELGPILEASVAGAPSAAPMRWRRAGPLRVRTERRLSSDWPSLRLTLQDTLNLLREPIHLHLEDETNDRRFIERLATHQARADLRRLADPPTRMVIHGGGTGALERWLRPLVECDSLTPAERLHLWRSWVMFDKDAGHDDARNSSTTSLRLMDLCETIYSKHRIALTWVCLQRREIESYIPDRALRLLRGPQRDAGWALQRMRERGDREAWAWALDLKQGLCGDLRSSVPESRRKQLKTPGQIPQPNELKAPFDALDAQQRKALAHGFGVQVLNRPLSATNPPDWLDELGDEYDRGPSSQLPRAELIQSIFDRI